MPPPPSSAERRKARDMEASCNSPTVSSYDCMLESLTNKHGFPPNVMLPELASIQYSSNKM
eukprot:3353-Amphidinium_carterae.1